MPMNAPIITDEAGKTWYQWDFRAKWAYPFDPDSPVFLLAAPPAGAGLANYPFLVKGDAGMHALISSEIDFIELEHDDVTPAGAEFVELVPGTEDTSQLSKLVLRLHKGAPGDDGTATLDPDAYGTPVAGRILVVNGTADGFVYAPQKVGRRYWPTTVTEAGAGTTAGHTLATVAIAANTYAFDYQINVAGSAVVTGSGADVKVDLVARLNSTTGPVIGRCYGIGGVTDRLQLVNGPDTNASAASVTVAANAAATVYLRAEKQAGADTYSTGASPSRFWVEVAPQP